MPIKFVRLDTLKKDPKYALIWDELATLEEDSGILVDGTYPILGAWDGKRLVGAVWVEDRKLGGYWNVAVLESARGQGVGTRLIAEFHKLAKKLKYEFLQCDPVNPMVGKLVVNEYKYKPFNLDWRLVL